MELRVQDYDPIEVQRTEDLAEPLSVLGQDGVAYAVLQRAEATFFAAHLTRPGCFEVEHRDGWTGGLFASRRKDFALAEVIDLFGAYLEREPAIWRRRIDWAPVDVPVSTRPPERGWTWSPRSRVLTRSSLPIVLLFAIVGVALGSAATWIWVDDQAFRASAALARGTVVRLEEVKGRRAGHGSIWFPVTRYATHDGRAVEFTHRVGSSPPRYAVGEAVGVLYDPRRPSHARLSEPVDPWVTAIGAFGCAFLGAAVAIPIGERRSRRRRAARALAAEAANRQGL